MLKKIALMLLNKNEKLIIDVIYVGGKVWRHNLCDVK